MRDHLANAFGYSQTDIDKHSATRNSAFTILYTRDLQLWQNHSEKPAVIRENKSPAFLMVRRSDYMMGFPGGGLKADETPTLGALQELKEELGITFLNKDRLEPLLRQTFTNTRGVKCNTHCFIAELNAEEFKSVLENAHKAEHFMAEMRGLIPVSMEHTSPEKPLPFKNFLHSPMAPSVRQDITDFLTRTEIIAPLITQDIIDAGLLPRPTQRSAAQPLQDNDLSHPG